MTDDKSEKAKRYLEGFLKKLSRQAVLSFSTCVHCGMCNDSCHYYLATGDPKMTPAYKADQVRKLFKYHIDWTGRVFPQWVGGKDIKTDEELEKLKDIVFGSCTMCRRCTMNCPFGIDKALMIRIARGLLILQDIGPIEFFTVIKDQWELGNQMGVTPDDYIETLQWLEEELQAEVDDTNAKIPIDKKGANIMYVVNPREIKYDPRSLLAAAKIFYAAKEDWTMPSVGWDNTNFGMFSGLDDLGGHIGKLDFDQAKKLKVKKIVISECGHGYRGTRWEAPNWAKANPVPIPMESFLETQVEYVNTGRIILDPAMNTDRVTYHDPCNLARSGGITEEPRFLLNRACMDFREMTPNRQDNFCCTGGGGAMSMTEFAKRRVEVAKIKADQIKATGAKVVATPCHNCLDGLADVSKAYKLNTPIRNICEFVADAIVLKRPTKVSITVNDKIKSKKILVIDDEPDVVKFLTVFLGDQGFKVVSANDGDEGIKKAKVTKPDLITLDVSMPGKSGTDVFKKLRSDPTLAAIPIIIVTGKVEFRKLIYDREMSPPEGYISKPVDHDVFLLTIKKILDKVEAKKEKKELEKV